MSRCMQERLPGRGAMSVLPPGRLPVVIAAEHAAPEMTMQYRYCVVRRVVRMISATDRM